MKQNNILIRAKDILKEKNILQIIHDSTKLIFEYFYYTLFKTRKFIFQEKEFNYFYYPYNATWRNERAIEIPIVWEAVKNCNGKILEFGNVLSYYFSVNYDILDKYEKAKGVINEDIINFKPKNKYDLIVSISTLEHVGWDEKPREPEKILKAIGKLKDILKKDGKMIITMPLGYNTEMDKMIKTGKIKFDRQYFLKRISRDNQWKEIALENIENIEYNKPFRFANLMFIGVTGGK